MPRMYNPKDGSVWDVDPSEVDKVAAMGGVPYGSPQHMAAIGVPGPMSKSAASLPMTTGDTSPIVQGIGRGIGKGAVSTAHGLFGMMGADPNSPGMRNMEEFTQTTGDPAVMGANPEDIGFGAEQVGEFALPEAAAGKAAKLMKVRNLVKQGRTATGAFTAATRTPVVRDLIRRALVRTGVSAAGTEVLNEAQGGTPGVGAAVGAGGTVLGETARIGGPIVKEKAAQMIERIRSLPPALQHAIGYGAGIGVPGLAAGSIYHHGGVSKADMAKAALLAAYVHPATTHAAFRATGALGLYNFDHMKPGTRRTSAPPINSQYEEMGGEGHKNKGD